MVGICRQAMMVGGDRTGDNDDYFGKVHLHRAHIGWLGEILFHREKQIDRVLKIFPFFLFILEQKIITLGVIYLPHGFNKSKQNIHQPRSVRR